MDMKETTLNKSEQKRSSLKRTRIKKISTKQRAVRTEYVSICRAIDERQVNEYGGIYCTSCHICVATPTRPIRSWGHSHLLPKGRFAEYATVMSNISPRCQSWNSRVGCHEKLDNRDWHSIKDFRDLDDIMENLYVFDKIEYNKFVSGLKSVNVDTYNYRE